MIFPRNGKDAFWLPDHEIEALAKYFLPSIKEYFDTPEGQEEFAAWQQEQEESNNSGVNPFRIFFI